MRRLQRAAVRALPVMLITGAAMTLSCESDKPPIAPAVKMRDSIPVMTTYGVSKLISDSGVIRYKIVAEEWKVFDRTSPPRQTFEKGLLLEKFNEKFHIQMYVTADTAFWYNQNLWELRGRVSVWNDNGTLFRSQLLYWDMNRHEFYSNKFSHLITPDREIKGHSFHSNEQMTQYEVDITQASFPIEDMTGGGGNAPADTTTQPAQTTPRTYEPQRATEKTDKKSQDPPKGHFK